MQLRIDLFGPSLSAITSCPQCKERLELSLSLPDSPQRPPDPGQEILISQGGYDLRLRLPNFRDLMNLSQTDHPPYDRRKLLDLCIQDAKHLGVKCNSEQLPKELIDAVSETMSEADSTSSDQLSLSCPSCHFSWQETLDTASFLWAEIDAWALRTLREVHAISSRYGWSESEILELSPLRRRIYLEMVSE
ncbi:MAG TPA: hypothetical protein PLD72_00215 [Methanothrix soehngenii]|nr:hypothetical protein [Methanothrix soehngenii]